MKKPIIAVLVLLGIGIFFDVIVAFYFKQLSILIQIGIELLIFIGVYVGHRLAWQWGRLLTMISFIFTSLGVFAILASGKDSKNLGGLIISGIISISIFILFGTKSAREHFEVICPDCSSTNIKANDFLFRTAKCKKCDCIF